jgi:hypothetical protein
LAVTQYAHDVTVGRWLVEAARREISVDYQHGPAVWLPIALKAFVVLLAVLAIGAFTVTVLVPNFVSLYDEGIFRH